VHGVFRIRYQSQSEETTLQERHDQAHAQERATESSGTIEKRLTLARSQLAQADEFDYVVENDSRSRAADELAEIVERELSRAATMSRP